MMDNYYSQDDYFYIPNRKSPRVELVVSSPLLVKTSFALYNPFSLKARAFKALMRFMFLRFNGLSKIFCTSRISKASEITLYLEEKYGELVSISIYHSTVQDKLILQTQSKSSGQTLNYIKVALNEKGVLSLKQETLGSQEFFELGLLNKPYQNMRIKGQDYLLVEPIAGDFKIHPSDDIFQLLGLLKSDRKYSFLNHPRVMGLRDRLEQKDLHPFVRYLDQAVALSKQDYAVVIEHGDFTPWNIIERDGQLFLIDFEYFVKEGIEFLDLMKYYFQIGRLLKKLSLQELVCYLEGELKDMEVLPLLIMYLLKEILQNKESGLSYQFEEEFLRYVVDEKA